MYKILVYDTGGIFYGVADAYSRAKGTKVYYYSSRTSNYPTPHFHIGDGFKNVERVDNPGFYFDKVDMTVFTDVNDGDLVDFLRRKKYKVLGSGEKGEELELDRVGFRKQLTKLGLPVAPYKVLKGVDALEAYMRKEKDKWIKISFWRGLKETHHLKEWDQDARRWFYDIAKDCGVFRDQVEFLAEDPIKGQEMGTDSIFSEGEFAKYVLFGMEKKSEAYICKTVEHSKLPKVLLNIDDKFAPIYKAGGIRGPISTEVRISDEHTGHYTDPCTRFGLPPFDLMCSMFGNFTELTESAAIGELIEPEVDYLYGASIFLTSEEAGKDYFQVEFPEEFSENVFLRAPVMVDGKRYTTPQEGTNSVGTVIGMADSLEEAISIVQEIADEVKGEGLGYRKEVFDDIRNDLKEAKKMGINF